MPGSEQPCSIHFQTEHVAKLSKEEMLVLGAEGGGGWREGSCPDSAWGMSFELHCAGVFVNQLVSFGDTNH